MHQRNDHFQGKDAHSHIQEVRENAHEAHGGEAPGHLSALADTMRDVAFILLLFVTLLHPFGLPFKEFFTLFCTASIGLIFWRAGRSGWLGWIRLERLHRLISQEKYEIEHHREQERDELIALYQAKGFEAPLLDQIVDHLMSDSDRLLKVMLEEEMGLNLEAYEHPLKQAAGAALGAFTSAFLLAIALYFAPIWALFTIAALLLAVSASLIAYIEKNRIMNAVIWTWSVAILAMATAYFALGIV